MPANSSPAERIKQLINGLKKSFGLISSDTQTSAKYMLKKINIYKLEPEKIDLVTRPLELQPQKPVVIKDVKRIYVLTKDLMKNHKEITATLKEYKFKKQIPPLKNFEPLRFIPHIINTFITPISGIFRNYSNVGFAPILKSFTDFSLPEATLSSLPIHAFDLPDSGTINLQLTTKAQKRSDIFPTNLPIEKKPLNFLLLSEGEIEFFKEKLAEKNKVKKRQIKLTSIYDKFNIKNLQNIKADQKSGNIYCNYKPKGNIVSDDNFAYLVFGYKRDDNKSLSAMVTTLEFEQFKYG